MIERHRIESREQWLALRKADVTASIIGALFSCHPWTSPLALYQEKCGLDLPHKDSVRLRRGSRLERAVAEEVGIKRPDWKVTKADEYFRNPELRLGATPDFFVEGDPRGLGVLQTKVSTVSAFNKYWRQDDGSILAPFYVSLQTLTEMLLTGATWGAAAVYLDDPWRDDCEICEVPRHEGAEAKIIEAVQKFWKDVAEGNEPAPDYGRDAALFALLYPHERPLKSVDLSGDNSLPVIISELDRIKARQKADEDRRKEIETELKFKMGDAEIATIGDFTVTLKTTNRKGYEVKPSSYRALRIRENRPAAATGDNHGASSGPF